MNSQRGSSVDPLMISIVMPVYRPEPQHLREAIQSVLGQTSEAWELVMVADGPQPRQVDQILEQLDDRRIVFHRRDEQGGIVAASNDAIDRASGEFVCFLDNDDTLDRSAIEACRDAILEHADTDVIYTDEDKLDMSGARVVPFHKPGWSPERLRSQMYIGHLAAYRRSLVVELGGLRQDFHGSQDHDLALRATECARRVVHIPRVLYHWRMAETSTALDPTTKDWAFEAGVRAVQSHLDRTGLQATAVRDFGRVGVVAVNPTLGEHPLVSLIVLTGGQKRIAAAREMVLVENCVESVVRCSTYPNYEIVVVLDQHARDELGDRLIDLGRGRVRIVRDTDAFSFAGANNKAVGQALGDHLIFLNDDTQVITEDWIERFVLLLSQDGVGAVGCCLEYPDGTIQHAGVFSRGGGPGHRSVGFHKTATGAFQALGLTLNSLAVTGACLGVSREKFEAVGGFSLLFPLNFNDVDLCLKLVSRGWRTVLDNRTRLIHFESSSREPAVESWEHLLLLERWWHLLDEDPWDNGNLYGYGVDELPPPTALTRLRELSGNTFAARSWPF
jgi:GT2 family glycosyltransferase